MTELAKIYGYFVNRNYLFDYFGFFNIIKITIILKTSFLLKI